MLSPLLIAMAIAGQSGGTAAEWKPYTSAKGKYTVSMPAKPGEKKRIVAVAGKTIEMVTATARKGLATYAATHADLAGADSDAALKAAQEDVVAQSKGTLKEEMDVTLGDQKGHELTIDIPRKVVAGGANQTSRIYAIGGRVYVLSAVVPTAKAEALADEVGGFFDSFKPKGVDFDAVADAPASKAAMTAKGDEPAKVGTHNTMIAKGEAKTADAKGAKSKSDAGSMLGGLLNPFATAKPKAPAEGAAPGDPPKGLGPEWKVFTPAAGGFSVALPGEPKEMKITEQTKIGPIEVVLYALEAGDGAYIVSGHEPPAGVGEPANVQTSLDNSKKGMLARAPGAKLVEEKKIEYQGFPGRDLTIEMPAGGQLPTAITIRVRVLIAKRQLIQLQAIRPGNAGEGKRPQDVSDFFDSLKIGDRN